MGSCVLLHLDPPHKVCYKCIERRKRNGWHLRLSLRRMGGIRFCSRDREGLNGDCRQVNSKMVRVLNSHRCMRGEATCHIDLATTG